MPRKCARPLGFPEVPQQRNQKLEGQRRGWLLVQATCAGLSAFLDHVTREDAQIGAEAGVTCFPCFTLSPPHSCSPLLPSHPPRFSGHLHPSINCQCASTAINQLFVSSCQSARDLCQLLLLITRRVRLEEKKRDRE